MMMKLILLATLASLAVGAPPPPPSGNWSVVPEPITDPVEKERRQKALEKAEKDEKEQNDKFLNGKSDFYERLNEWSDLPEDEFEKEKAGDVESFARGLLEPELKPVDARDQAG